MSSSAEQLLSALRAGAWSKVADLRKGLWFTLGAILVYRLGTYIPVPGVNPGFMDRLLNTHWSDALDLFDVFTGGAVRRFSLFTLNIAPYLSAVGLINAATPVIPRLSRLKDQGIAGKKQLNSYAVWLGTVMSLVLSYQVARSLEGAHDAFGSAVNHPGWLFRVSCMVTMTGGMLLLTWLGQQMNERGIGLGFILIGTSGLFVSLPVAIGSLSGFRKTAGLPPYTAWGLLPVAGIIITAMVFFEMAQRRIPVRMPRRDSTNRRAFDVGGPFLPIRTNPSSMAPSVTATTILLLPSTLFGFLDAGPAVRQFFQGPLGRGQPLYLLLYAMTTVAIAFVSAAHAVDGKQIAQQLKVSGQFVPGQRPGLQTAVYLNQIRIRLTLVGAVYLCGLCVPLELLIGRFGLPTYFTGAALVGIVTLIGDIVDRLNFITSAMRYDGLIHVSRR
jgi:preprotein translocase subunit SecY